MNDPRFVVVGSGRHGSGYIAAVLNAVGIRCGHESWFTPTERTQGLEGDSSWCAVPVLHSYRGMVLHQTREPLGVISSLVKAPLWGPYRNLIELKEDDPVDEAISIYVDLNEECSRHARFRWRLEDVNPSLIGRLGEIVGHPVDHQAAVRAIEQTPTDTNFHGDGVRLTWADLDGRRRLGELEQLAFRYGYLRR